MEFNSSSPKTISVVSTFATPFDNNSPPVNGTLNSQTRKPIALWPGMYHSPVTSALWEARSKIFERLLDPPKDAPPQSELLTKTPKQSRTSILYNFSSDYILREQYRDPWNEVRIGKLLEDLDALAGTISVKEQKKRTKECFAEGSDTSDSVALTANFIFVARDSKTGKAAPVNHLSPETQEEKLLFKEAEARSILRKRKRVEERKECENGEVNRLEALLAEGRIFCDMPALADRGSILLRIPTLKTL
ncbi:hypothetical protein GH714_029338 [Hevea brasiliensis]|uniref:HotDog ACOT-type domain-containing protein n=1 Tax=Hevea brasiliensis TaxID=3981 RepID=A0A6A6K858_HEVBR|nr:hypothetical protein GH714_029338 [Hevea brasiliensis]